jgi:hypothetical protein
MGLCAGSQNQFTKQLAVGIKMTTSIQKITMLYAILTNLRGFCLFTYWYVGYLSTLSVSTPHNVDWMDDRGMP